MARYTPEFLAAARHGYENTDQPMTALAAALGIGITTLQTLVRKHGWTPRSERMRDSPAAIRLLEEAEALASASPPPTPNPSPPLATLVEGGEQIPTLPLAAGGSEVAAANDAAFAARPVSAPAPSEPSLTPVERLEALVVRELAAEEAARAELALRPRSRHDAERCARTLSVLTQTLQTLQRIRVGGAGASNAVPYDDMPEDLDAFRFELARRIRILIENRQAQRKLEAEKAQANLAATEAAREAL